jgi:monoamine oxidase
VRRAAVAAAGVCIAPSWVGGQSRRIFVIGAGMAGLSAAFELRALGHDVTVL